ncbi:type II toxin-antitoxin system VapC family toxin [Microcella flavibacter]|uniref:type II toxin-antitoxin system VapC family toxin n=1 Tax=Microcella flavibacter TaxID=1804990 RepID=UPI001456E7D3|nr:type II toxin-antitoxin system VapC family toxin [Microcella flavibacter]
MIVIDASVLVSLVAGDRDAVDAVVPALEHDAHWAAPPHARIEAVSALRGMALRRSALRDELPRMVERLLDIELDVWPTDPLLGRVVQLVDNVSAYDAAYIALAEELSTTLVTLDRRLAGVPGIHCRVLVPGGDAAPA